MHYSKLLEGFTILDFTHRLPGPLAGRVLTRLGARVYKIEDENFKDAFLSGVFSQMDNSFEDWYQHLNENKALLRLNFKSETAKIEIKKLLQKADGILMGLPPKVKSFLELTPEHLSERNICVLEMGASEKIKEPMHDLNALAHADFLSLYIHDKDDEILAPPFLPFSGIAFGQYLATQMLGGILQARKKEALVWSTGFLYETIEDVLTPFWSPKMKDEKRTKFLHNGAFPCYCLYRLKDGNYAALAAVEPRFWQEFSELFPNTLKHEKRFNTDKQSFEQIAQHFLQLDAAALRDKIKNKHFCLSIVERI